MYVDMYLLCACICLCMYVCMYVIISGMIIYVHVTTFAKPSTDVHTVKVLLSSLIDGPFNSLTFQYIPLLKFNQSFTKANFWGL